MFGTLLLLLKACHVSPVPFIANILGTGEPALNLLISILLGFPLGIVYHKHVIKHVQYRNLFFILSGLDLAYFNFGLTLYHNVIPVLLLYFTTLILGPGKNNTIITIIINMTYLLVGYVATESEEYDITWTMPHCVLTLKLIALAFDMWDGMKMIKGEELSVNSKKTALDKPPTFMELLGFVYFPAAFLVGPIFSFKRYKDFISDKYPLDKDAAVYEKQAMMRLVQGVLYLMAFQIGVAVFNTTFMQSDEFWETSIFYRHFYCGMWAHFALYKYIACWLLTEAACIRFGLSYNGTQEAGAGAESRWDGCSNIKLMRFEGATKFQHYIDSFNCNTNYFAAEYVYKRLKFLGDRNLSQFFTLMFLALWHGIRSGYYMTFFNEFMIIFMEKGIESMLRKTTIYERLWSHTVTSYILYAILKAYAIVFMGWSLVPFDLKVFSKWYSIYYSLYFSGFILFLPWAFLYKPLLKKAIVALKISKTESREKVQ